MLLLPIIPSLLGYIHGSSEDNFSEKWENGLLRHSMWPLANFLFLGSRSILMSTRFILIKMLQAHPNSKSMGVRFGGAGCGLVGNVCTLVSNDCNICAHCLVTL